MLKFDRYFHPSITNNGLTTMDLDKSEGITNPKPDCIYGISPDEYDTHLGVHISAEIQLVREAVPMMYDPVSITKGKSDRGEAEKTEN